MTLFRNSVAASLAMLVALVTIAHGGAPAGEWPQFRGWRAQGVADGRNPPVVWNVESGQQIRWKTPIAGLGHASPVVSRGCVFIVTAKSSDPDPELRVGLYGDIASVQDESVHQWQLYCLCKDTGQVLWQRTLHQGVPKIKRHTKATHANTTPATDGTHVVVFLGSEGLFCYDFCGNLLWKRDLGVLDAGYYVAPDAQWGFASSPIIYRNTVFVQCDVQRDSFLAAFDICNGRQLWRTARHDVPTWSTPNIDASGPREQLIVNGYRHAGGYDPWTGKELWKLGGGGDIPVPTPIVAHGLIYLTSSHGSHRPLCAIQLDALGDITPTSEPPGGDQLAWYKPRDGIYMQTPLVYGEYLYACKNNGVLSCYAARTGELMYRQRLGGGGFTASAVAADGRIYLTGEAGDIFVVRAGPTFELLAKNSFGEICMATPAIVDRMLIVRTASHVYGIGAPRNPNYVPRGRRFLRPRRVPRQSRRVPLLARPAVPLRHFALRPMR